MLLVPGFTCSLIVSLTYLVTFTHCFIVTNLLEGLITNFHGFFKHHRFVGDVTILIEARLTFLFLCWDVVSDECIVTFLSECVLTLYLVFIHCTRHLHHLVDTSNFFLFLFHFLCLFFIFCSILSLSAWAELWRCSILVLLWLRQNICPHIDSESIRKTRLLLVCRLLNLSGRSLGLWLVLL